MNHSDTVVAVQAPARVRAAVLVARGFGIGGWDVKYASGALVGTNERMAYGYFHAEAFGIDVHYSVDAPENALVKLARLGLRAILGFDLVHAWRNRALLLAADVIWTHTESQSLAVCALLALLRPARPPRLLLQQVWLIDRWPRLTPLHRWLYQRLLRRADLLTFHSEMNLAKARTLFPGQRCELVRFGINASNPVAPSATPWSGSLRVLSLGNDRHRDWPTLLQAVADTPGAELRILSGSLPPKAAGGMANVQIGAARTQQALEETYAWADLVVVPLKANLHASGITVIQEAVLKGLPVITADAGGLEAYFGDDCIWYYRTGDANALRETIAQVRAQAQRRLEMAQRAQAHMGDAGLGSVAYARRHAELSRELLEQPALV
ncbi:glycosyltransferase [Pseudoxanthomonas sp. GM95]|uniref:glycosyltransferase n=1 Tax=Pseudoxanthomonas sp. GM95 TaxID=1881043 RepID=UPI001C313262|nr:glycosyltransferase [Pseudoxanthomonas sp. GM95]